MALARKHPVADVAAASLVVTVILLPKGGFRLGPLPITWGYMLLMLSIVAFLPYRFLETQAIYVRRQMVALFTAVPFALVFCYSALAFGAAALAGFVSTLVSLVVLPLLFLWFYPPLLPLVRQDRFLRWFRGCVLAAALFGILLFFWRPLTGSWLQIPYVTVNADDIADFSNTKDIARGYFFKLISTYNNGNIYGAATLTVFRMYTEATKSRWQRWTLWIALFLTLSRTVWAGMLFDRALSIGALLVQQRHRFPVLRLGGIFWVALSVGVVTPLYFLLTSMLGAQQANGFLLDPTLGGRTAQFVGLGSAPFFPSAATGFFFTEITYLSAINQYGYIGAVTITLLLLSPLLVLLCDRRALQDPYRRAAFKGLLLYALVSTSDGAINFIPVMAFYWFTYMVFLFGMPGRQPNYLSTGTHLPEPVSLSSVQAAAVS